MRRLKGRKNLLFAAVFMLCLLLMKPSFAATNYFHYKDKVLILTYHHIDEHQQAGATVTPAQFRSHMQMLWDHGYRVISMPQFITYMQKGLEIPENAVVITFDDGYESFYTKAAPILNEYGYAATNFIIVNSVENAPPGALPHMSWKQMKELKRQGMSFYSHTYNQHHKGIVDKQGTQSPVLLGPLLHETEADAKARIYADLKKADDEIDAHLGKQPRILAFPYGMYTPLTIQTGKEAGVELFFTVSEGSAKRGDEPIKRINAGAPDITAQVLLEKMKTYDEKPPVQEQK